MIKVSISEPANVLAVERYAKQMGLSADAAVEKLITVAKNRINALRKHAKKKADEAPLSDERKPKAKKEPKPKPAAKKEAKPKAKKEAKPKAKPVVKKEEPSEPKPALAAVPAAQ
jgi:outer membrane biosynthesis protein TonB